jgi:phosphoribosylamine---glycine ligase
MKVLIVGNGGRESALAVKLKDERRIAKLYFAKGNATTDELGQNINISDIAGLRDFAIKEKIDLTIVGPEAPLVDGLVDEFKQHGLLVFGPRKRAAELEGSKAFSKKFMFENGIKTATAKVFDAYHDAIAYVEQHSYPVVIKASGLAGGKGVVICENVERAKAVVHSFMIDRIYGDAGIQLVIEEYLTGFETSIIAFSNGKDLFPCIPIKDYKKVGNGDRGANTGGMGTMAPNPQFTEAHLADFRENILAPTIAGLHAQNLNFKGIIFFGLMVTEKGTYLLEYNMRFGDPETQVLMALMENKLLDVILDCLDGKDIDLRFKNEKAVCLVMCSGGYPGEYETGYEVRNIDKVTQSQLLFAGADKRGERVVTTGGRVLNLVATGSTIEEARKKVYEDAIPLHFDYAFYRDDIGK